MKWSSECGLLGHVCLGTGSQEPYTFFTVSPDSNEGSPVQEMGTFVVRGQM
jgi:hypothetical protein